MGVMQCYRNGCNNVMCSHYSEEYGYICRPCLIEMDRKQVYTHRQILDFMFSLKDAPTDTLQPLDVYSIFTIR